MTRNLLLLWVVLSALPACSLQRGAISCSEGSMYEPGSLCVPVDGAIADAHMVDGGMPSEDAGDAMMPDASLPDGGDAGPDSGPSDGGTDAGTDSGPLPDGGMESCETSTSDFCFRFENLVGSPDVTDWMIQFYWTVPGGAIFRIPDNRSPEGDAIFAPACEVFRRIDARTTECEITTPDPGMVTIGAGPFYAFPTYASGPACTSTGCPAYSAGYRMWQRGVEFSTAAAGGRVSQESRPTAAGVIVVLRLIP